MTHRNVTNLVCLSPGDLNIRPGSSVAQLLNVSFDMGELGSVSIAWDRGARLRLETEDLC